MYSLGYGECRKSMVSRVKSTSGSCFLLWNCCISEIISVLGVKRRIPSNHILNILSADFIQFILILINPPCSLHYRGSV